MWNPGVDNPSLQLALARAKERDWDKIRQDQKAELEVTWNKKLKTLGLEKTKAYSFEDY